MTIELAPMIVADKHTLGGKPRIAGTRISVALVLEQLSNGRTFEELLESYPTLERDHILACLAYARNAVEEEEILFTAA
jgi:uncharacterized protein (DUF433 family)